MSPIEEIQHHNRFKLEEQMISEKDKVLLHLHETLAALYELKPEERSESARRIQIVITEYEKLLAYYFFWVIQGGGKND